MWNHHVTFVFLPSCTANDSFSSPSVICQPVRTSPFVSIDTVSLSLSRRQKRSSLRSPARWRGRSAGVVKASSIAAMSSSWTCWRASTCSCLHKVCFYSLVKLSGDCCHEWFIEILSFRTSGDSCSPLQPLSISLLMFTYLWFFSHLFLNIFVRPGENLCSIVVDKII